MGKKKYYGHAIKYVGEPRIHAIVIQALPKNEYKEWLKVAKVKFAKNTLKEINKYALLEKKKLRRLNNGFIVSKHYSGSSHDHHGAPTGFVKRWLYSTNHKDIGTMYIIFAIVAAFIGGAMSIYMRMELMNPGVQYMEDGHVWNVFTTAHGLIMVFFVVMPGLIGGFGIGLFQL